MDAKITLPESDLPRSWYNILADAPTPPQPPLHPGTGQPIGPGDLDEQFVVSDLHFPNFPAIDDGRERQHLSIRVPQHGKAVMACDNRTILDPFGMDHQDFPQRHHRLHPQRSKAHLIRFDEIIRHGKHDGCQAVQSNGHGPPFAPENIGQLFLRLDELCQAILGHAIAHRRTGRYVGTNLFHSRRHDQFADHGILCVEEGIGCRGPALLGTNLPSDTFAAP